MLGPEGEADLAPAKSMFAIRTCFPECVPDRVPALPQCSICKKARGVVLWALLPIKPVRYPMSDRLLQPDSIFHIKKSTNQTLRVVGDERAAGGWNRWESPVSKRILVPVFVVVVVVVWCAAGGRKSERGTSSR